MAPVWYNIEDIDDLTKPYAMKLRLVRCYGTLSFKHRDLQSYECVFHDSKGDRVQVSIPRNLIQVYREVLHEGKIYGLRRFKLVGNSGKYRVTVAKFRIVVHEATQITQLLIDDFLHQRFSFQSFEKILQMDEGDDDALLDVIGVLVDLPEVHSTSSNGVEKKLLNIQLEDLHNNKLTCTLWEEYVDMFNKMFEEQTTSPIVVIVQLCKPNLYRGPTLLASRIILHIYSSFSFTSSINYIYIYIYILLDIRKVNNVLHATNVILNGAFEEVDNFRQRYVEKMGHKSALSKTVLSGQSSNDEYVEGSSIVKSILELFDDDELVYCWIKAVVDVVDFKYGWHYLSCPKCRRKLDVMGNQYFCNTCNAGEVLPVLRYKLNVHVKDGTGFVHLLLWDKESVKLLGKTAEYFAALSVMEAEKQLEEQLLKKTFLFKIQLQNEQRMNFGGSFTVIQIAFESTPVQDFFESQESNYLPNVGDGADGSTVLTKLGNTSSCGVTDDGSTFSVPIDLEVTPINNSGANLSTGKRSTNKKKIVDGFEFVDGNGGGGSENIYVKRNLENSYAVGDAPKKMVYIKKEKS